MCEKTRLVPKLFFFFRYQPSSQIAKPSNHPQHDLLVHSSVAYIQIESTLAIRRVFLGAQENNEGGITEILILFAAEFTNVYTVQERKCGWKRFRIARLLSRWHRCGWEEVLRKRMTPDGIRNTRPKLSLGKNGLY